MSAEETILQKLTEKFADLQPKSRVQRARRLWTETASDKFNEVLEFLQKDLGFTVLLTITGTDEGATMALLYHLAQPGGICLTLKVAVPKEKPAWKTITDRFPNADIYEREVVDLLGFQMEGLKPGHNYPLPDGWPSGEYPLRKDWQPKAAPEAAKPGGTPQ